MTIQSNINSVEVASQRQFSWPLALAILVLGIVLGVFASLLVHKTEVAAAPEQISREVSGSVDTARTQAAEAARYNSLGLFYAAGNGQPALAVETARYEGLADYYGVERQSALAAETARYEGLAEADRQPALVAEIARYEGLTEYYDSHSLAWPPRPTQFHNAGNAGMNLDPQVVHHPGTLNADSDLGLMDFSAAETVNQPRLLAWPSRPSHFFLAKNGVESDPNADIGLME